MIRTIHFHNGIAEHVGITQIKLDVNSPRQLLAGLRSQVPNFRSALIEYPTMVVVLANSENTRHSTITPELFEFPLNGDAEHIHLVTDVQGAGFDPLSWAIIISEAINVSMATAIFLVQTGINLATAFVIGLVSKALSPHADTSEGSGRPDERPSFLFNGAVNVVEQGYPVPLVYGIHTTGSVVVSAGVDVAELPYDTVQDTPPANGGGWLQPAAPAVEPFQWDR